MFSSRPLSGSCAVVIVLAIVASAGASHGFGPSVRVNAISSQATGSETGVNGLGVISAATAARSLQQLASEANATVADDPVAPACTDLDAMQKVRDDLKLLGKEWGDSNACPCDGNVPKWHQGSYTCSKEGRVVALKFEYKFYDDNTLPASIGQLTALQDLDFKNNPQLKGTLPVEFSAMTKLKTLNLANTGLSGTIPLEWSALRSLELLALKGLNLADLPTSFSTLKRLQTVSLESCNITGVPPLLTMLPNITDLDLTGNNMTVNGQLPLDFTSMTTLRELTLLKNTGPPNGTIPDEYSSLTFLKSLSVDNVRHDSIPRWFGTLTGLKELVIQNASMAGTIPDWLTEMTSLQKIDLDSNDFTGGIPVWFTQMESLADIRLGRNKNLRGEPPEELSLMTQLKAIALGSCSLSGSIPTSWSTLTNLENMWIENNAELSGTLPDAWSELAKLQMLWLHSSKVSGSLPASWSTMTGMKEVMIYNARLSGSLPESYSTWSGAVDSILIWGNQLTGTLPASWSTMSGMRQLGLSANQLEGPLPDSWSTMSSKMNVMLLQSNKLAGTLPASYSNMKSLQHMYLQGNQLTGPLPEAWANDMNGVITIDLSHNTLNGTLPASWASKKDIQVLSLNSNKGIAGTLPVEWSSLSKVSTLSLQDNAITGSVPETWSTMTKLKKMDMSNNKLEGWLPRTWSSMTELQMLDVSYNQLSGGVPKEWKDMHSLTYLGLQGNPGLCRGWYYSSCFTDLATPGGWAKLAYVSAQGGSSIPWEWTNRTVVRPMLLFVEHKPRFDKTMEKVCLDERPARYNFTFVEKFNMYDEVLRSNAGASETEIKQYIDSTLDVALDPGNAVTKTLNATFSDLKKLITKSKNGWVLGSGGWHDPCVPKYGWINTFIMYGIFFLALLLVGVDWFLQVKTGDTLKNKVSHWFSNRSQSSEPEVPAENPTLSRTMAFLSIAALLASYLGPFCSMAVDILSDLILINELWPHKSGLLLLAAFLISDWISAVVIYRRIYSRQQQLINKGDGTVAAQQPAATGAAKKDIANVRLNPSFLESAFKRVISMDGVSGTLCRWLMAITVIPIMSFSMHITAAILAVLVVINIWRKKRVYVWSIMGLDVNKIVIFRSFVVAFIEAPAAIAFTSWAYLSTNKSEVGKYISDGTFYFNLVMSMFHIVMEVILLKELMIKHDHSLRAALEDISTMTEDETGAGDSKAIDLVNAISLKPRRDEAVVVTDVEAAKA